MRWKIDFTYTGFLPEGRRVSDDLRDALGERGTVCAHGEGRKGEEESRSQLNHDEIFQVTVCELQARPRLKLKSVKLRK